MSTDMYQTSNLQLAAYLYASNLEFIGITKTDNKALFNFRNKGRALELMNKYFSGKASLDPRELFARLNDLKDLIFSGGRL